jgi:hypothetical protein
MYTYTVHGHGDAIEFESAWRARLDMLYMYVCGV